jgi:hypothetical protein
MRFIILMNILISTISNIFTFVIEYNDRDLHYVIVKLAINFIIFIPAILSYKFKNMVLVRIAFLILLFIEISDLYVYDYEDFIGP